MTLSTQGRLWSGVALLMSLGCGSGDEEFDCPSGWERGSDGLCLVTESQLEVLRQTIGTGAYGFAHSTEHQVGHRNLGAGLEVVAYDYGDLVNAGFPPQDECYAWFEVTETAKPAAVATTDEKGTYMMRLESGRYALTSIDPVDGCPFLAGAAEIDAENPLAPVVFGFFHEPT